MAIFQIPSQQEYEAALRRVIDTLPASHVRMLQAHCRAKDRTLTTRQLADAAGYKHWRAVNLQYGTLGRKLRSETGFDADGQASFVIASFEKEDDEKEWRWIMHEELARALQAIKLV